eukprot:1071347-Prymnesium_polylepis.1
MWTSVTKLVSDKLSETTTTLMANYNAKFAKLTADYNARISKRQDQFDSLEAQVAALTARSAYFENGALSNAPNKTTAAKPAPKKTAAAKPAPKKTAAKPATPNTPNRKKPAPSPRTSSGVQKKNDEKVRIMRR